MKGRPQRRDAAARVSWRGGSFRALVIPALALLGVLPLWVGAGASEVANDASRPNFVTGSAYAQAFGQEATGIYVLGTTRIRGWSATHYLLVRYGRGLQIQTKANGAWLPKLDGSSGGHTIGAERFDELLSIAGGVNRDVRQLSSSQRDRFFCIAGFGGCVGQTSAVPAPDRSQLASDRQSSSPGSFFANLLGASASAAEICAQCQPYFASAEPGREFRFEFDQPARGLWFHGWGIRGGWRVPPPDEI